MQVIFSVFPPVPTVSWQRAQDLDIGLYIGVKNESDPIWKPRVGLESSHRPRSGGVVTFFTLFKSGGQKCSGKYLWKSARIEDTLPTLPPNSTTSHAPPHDRTLNHTQDLLRLYVAARALSVSPRLQGQPQVVVSPGISNFGSGNLRHTCFLFGERARTSPQLVVHRLLNCCTADLHAQAKSVPLGQGGKFEEGARSPNEPQPP